MDTEVSGRRSPATFVALTFGVLATVLMHAMDNLSWQLFPVGGSAYDPLFVAPFTVAAAILAVAMCTRIVPRWSARSLRPG